MAKVPLDDRVEIVAAMKDVREHGVAVARHLRGEIYEVRASGRDVVYRVLFAREGRYRQVLLALEAFAKKSQRAPRAAIELAEGRLRDWRARARARAKTAR